MTEGPVPMGQSLLSFSTGTYANRSSISLTVSPVTGCT